MRPVALLVVALLTAALAPFPGSPASADCAAPTLHVAAPGNRPALLPGAQLTVAGQYFVQGCDDTGAQDSVFGCAEEREAVLPMTEVELVLRQQGREWPLGTADADGHGDISWDVRVPAGLRPGRARLLTEDSEVLVVAIPAR